MRPAIETLRHRLLPWLVLLTASLLLTLARPAYAAENLLAGRMPSRTSGVSNTKVLTDGARAFEGEEWNTTAAAVFESERAFVEFDLGQPTKIAAAYLQGDNNDEYVVTVSDDHTTFTPLWTAAPRNEPGLRERWADNLTGQGRWLRVGVRGGDRAYSVTEIQVWSERPATLPPALSRLSGESQAARVRSTLLYLVAAFGVFLFITEAASKLGALVIGAALPIVALVRALDAINGAWPLANREVAFVRAAAAAIALLAVLRRIIPGKRWPARRGVVIAAMASAAVMASAAFYNLGYPQFNNHKDQRREFVHTYDMRVYQPFAKYFKELQYDGVYYASVLAYAEDQRGGSLDAIGRQEVRGLTDHRVRRVGDIKPEIMAVRQRFSDERWNELKQDMRYFEDVMGPEFLGTLTDHGANATPVWVFFARLFLGHSVASEGVLTLAGLVDAALLLLMAVAMWRSFGLLPALLAVTVFGANDLYMFGTNWTGATLRHDWLALLGFGACALKKERWVIAGICLALSAMIRAFPAAALLGVALPALWWVFDSYRANGKLPHWKTVLREHPEAVRVIGSALACMVVMFLLTAALYSPSSWLNWWHKVTLLNRDVGVNEISLRALVAGADSSAGRVMQARFLIYGAAWLGSALVMVLLAHRRPLYQAMLIAMPFVIVIWNPSNYYSHFVFLLALLASTVNPRKSSAATESADAPTTPPRDVPLLVPFQQVAMPLLALCIGGYWSSLEPDLERHFQNETVLLFLALAWLYTNLMRRDPELKPFVAG
jgi:hypothetical protein